MRNPIRWSIPILLLTSALAAQGEPGAEPGAGPIAEPIAELGAELGRFRVPIHTSPDDFGRSYGVWAAGADYKCSFHDGMTFVPYLGAAYPRSVAWRWTTTGVQRGALRLLRDGEQPTAAQSDWRYEYRFGAFTEAYDVRLEGLEQTFVFDRLPGAGDLVITGRVTTGLSTPAASAAHQSLTFCDDRGDAIVTYGSAVVVDAAGQRRAITTEARGDEISLRVPASWLEHAELPVTVDPLLAPVMVHNGAQNVRTPSIAYVAQSTQPVLVAYRRAVSNFEDDVYAVHCRPDFTLPQLIYYDITASWDSDDVTCAATHPKWAIVFRRYVHTGPQRPSGIRAHLHPFGSTTVSLTTVGMPRPTSHNLWRPTVSYVSPGNALVLCQVENNAPTNGNFANVGTSQIRAAPLDTSTTHGSFGSLSVVLSHATRDYERPTIADRFPAVTGPTAVCAYQVRDTIGSNADWEVHVRRIDAAANLSASTFTSALAADNSLHQVGPHVAGRFDHYALCYATRSVGGSTALTSEYGTEIRVERFDWPWNAPAVNWVATPRVLESAATASLAATGIDQSLDHPEHFAVGWLRPNVARGAVVGYTGAPTHGPFDVHPSPGEPSTGAAVAWDDGGSGFTFAYGVAIGPNRQVNVREFEFDVPAPITVAGNACGNTSTPFWSGGQRIGSRCTIFQNSAASNTLHFMLVSLLPAQVPITVPGVASGCELLVDNGPGYLGAMIAVGQQVAFEFALPEWLPSTTLHLQAWLLAQNQFTASARRTVPVVR